MTQAILGKAAATVSTAEAEAAEARKRERFRTARLTAFNAWVFGASMLPGFTHRLGVEPSGDPHPFVKQETGYRRMSCRPWRCPIELL